MIEHQLIFPTKVYRTTFEDSQELQKKVVQLFLEIEKKDTSPVRYSANGYTSYGANSNILSLPELSELKSFIDSIVNNWIKKFGGLNVPESETIGLVVKTQCDYFSGLTFPNGVDCGLVCQDKGYSSVTYEVALFNQCDEAAAAQIKFVHVYVDAITRKAVALPKSLEKALLKISRY